MFYNIGLRFIGLAEVGNPAKQKWIYAFNIVPMDTMEKSELLTQPTNVTEMPFKDSHLKLAPVSFLGLGLSRGLYNKTFYGRNLRIFVII